LPPLGSRALALRKFPLDLDNVSTWRCVAPELFQKKSRNGLGW